MKTYVIQLPKDFEVPKYDGRVRYIAVPVKRIVEVKEVENYDGKTFSVPHKVFIMEEK